MDAAILRAQAAVRPIVIPVVTAGGVAGAAGAAGATSAAAASTAALGAAGTKAAKGLSDAERQMNILKGAAIGLSRITPVTVFGLGAAGSAAIALGSAVKFAIGSAADLEQTLNTFQVITGATADEMGRVSEAVIDLGADLTLPATSALDAADALNELAKAGLSIEDSINAAKGVLQLGTAAGLAPADAASIVATQLNAFNLKGTEATHVADLLTGASIAAQGEILDFGVSMQQVSAVAFQTGLSLETTTGALTEMARAGLRGADSGTSLRTLLLRLVPTTKEAAEFQKKLGIEFDKSRSAGEQLPELLDQYREALNLLTPAQQQLALAQIFGQDAIRAAAILIRGGSGALDEATAAADRQGIAAEVAAAKTKGLKGAFANLQSQSETLATNLGTLVTGPLAALVTKLADIVGGAAKAAEALVDLAEKAKDLGDKIPFSEKAVGLFKDVLHDAAFAAIPFGASIDTVIFSVDKLTAAWERYFGVAPVEPPRSPFLGRRSMGGAIDPRTPQAIAAQERAANAAAVITPTPEAIAAGRRFEEDPVQKAIRQQDEAARRKAINDSLAPRRLRDPVLKAQLEGNLQAELNADKDIVEFWRKRLKTADEGTARYTKILESLTTAQGQVDSVQQAITSQQEQAAAKAKSNATAAAAAAKSALDVREAELRMAADAAGNVGPKENALLVFLQQRRDDAKRGTQEFVTAQQNLASEQAKNKQAVVSGLQQLADAAGNVGKAETALIVELKRQLAEAIRTGVGVAKAREALAAEEEKHRKAEEAFADLQNQLQRAILDNAISRADLTPGDTDDRAAQNRLLKFLRNQRDKAITIANRAKDGSKAEKEAQLAVQEWQAQINQTLKAIQDLDDSTGGGGAFTLNDLFKAAADQFKDFGSNISQAATTAGGARTSLAGDILAQKPDNLAGVVTKKANEQLGKTDLTNQYLKEIRDHMVNLGLGTPDTPEKKKGRGGVSAAVAAAKYANAGIGSD